MSIKKILKTIVIGLYRLSMIGLSKGSHLTRYYVYKHLSTFAEPRSKDLKVLSISGSQYLGRLLGFDDKQIKNVSYPEFNVLNLPFRDGEFDAVVSDYVLEHIEGSPQSAIDEMFRILRPNGVLLLTTNLIYPVHAAPNDYWRFTPDALVLLTKQHGDILDVGGWGNPCILLAIALGLWSQPTPHARWHPAHWLATKNIERWAIGTWVLVKKSSRVTRCWT